jgi:DNA-binding protein HU-beta
MHKNELIQRVSDESGVSREVVADVINRTLTTIVDEVAHGNRVVLTGFGTFEQRHRRARRGVDPRSGAEIMVPATQTPGFTASTLFMRRLGATDPSAEPPATADASEA